MSTLLHDRGRDPLVDVRDREDMRANYLDGVPSARRVNPTVGGSASNWPVLAMSHGSCWCHAYSSDHKSP